MNEFKFSLGQSVNIIVSGEGGTIRGRAEYTYSSNCYLVEYKENSTGTAREAWFAEDQLN